MRPKYLEIEGLQSFRDVQRIDFERLSETGLFGIFGPTGSGKSTILDAITLALYGTVQRALRGTQGIVNSEMNSLRVSFTFELIKGQERKLFRVERLYKRKKDSDSAVEAKLSRLFEVVAGQEVILADKQGDVNNSIIELVGLQFDDFTRTVVLPQNKFQDFLLAPKAEKTKMMEKIFYLEEYGRLLWDRVTRKQALVRNRLSGIEGGMAALGDLSHTSMNEIEGDMKAALKHKEDVAKALSGLEETFNQSKAIWALQTELEEVSAKQQLHRQDLQRMSGMKHQVEMALLAKDVMTVVHQYQEAETALETTKMRSAAALDKLKALEIQLHAAQKKYDINSNALKQELPGLIEYKARLADGLVLKKEIETMTEALLQLRSHYNAAKKAAEEKQNAIAVMKTELESLTKTIETNRKSLSSFRTDLEYRRELQAALKLEEDKERLVQEHLLHKKKTESQLEYLLQLEKMLQLMQDKGSEIRESEAQLVAQLEMLKKEKPAEQTELIQFEGQYNYYKATLEGFIQSSRSIEALEKEMRLLSEQLLQKTAAIQAGEIEISKIENEKTALAIKIEEHRKQQEANSAYRLAQGLKDGVPCPVCGSGIHPHPAASTMFLEKGEEAEALQEKDRRYKQAWEGLEAGYKDVENQSIKLKEQHKHLLNLLEQNKQKNVQLIDEKIKLQTQLPERLRNEILEGFDEERLISILKTMHQENNQKQAQLKAWEDKAETIQKRLDEIRAALSKQAMQENSSATECKLKKMDLQQAETALSHAALQLQETNKQYEGRLAQMGLQSIKKEIEQMEHNDAQAEKMQKEMDAQTRSIEILRRKIEEESILQKQLDERLSDVVGEGKTLKIRIDSAEEKLKQLVKSQDIQMKIQNTQKQIQLLTQQEQEAQSVLEQCKLKHQTENKEMAALEKQQEIFGEKLDDEEKKMKKVLAEKGFADISQVEQAVLDNTHLEQLKGQVVQFEEQGKQLETQAQLLSAKLGGQSLSRESWERLFNDYEAMKLEKEESIAQYEQKNSLYNSTKNSREKWLILEQELKQYSRQKDNLDQIQKLLKGNGFIEFISEERLRYIAREATETLGVLTKYRYALELDSENGFVIVDNMNGGLRRMVASLSGGEIFLTSLSLALALSSQIQLKGQSPLEFFFLDEGFGTLDNDLLDTVIDALERLSTTQRIIGLISHVPELRNRIQRRLVVEPPNSTGAGSVVRIERA